MSKNFELLQRAQSEQTKLDSVPGASRNGDRPRLNLAALASEEGVKMVQRVFLLPGPSAPRAVVFSGIAHGDGCSWICASAAAALAEQVAGSVCVVDSNWRTPALHRFFGVENRNGLAQAVEQTGAIRDFVQQVEGIQNLWVLPSGPLSENSPTFIHTERFRGRIAELRAEFDTVLLDAPPTNLYADAVTLGQLADGVVLVLQSNSTRREAARQAKASFEAGNVRLLGAVLNKRTFPVPQVFYGKL